MKREDEILLLEELLGLKQEQQLFLDEKAHTNPVSDYTDPGRMALERHHIFERLPSILAHSSELPSAHSFLRRDLYGQSLLLSRAEDGQVRIFKNVCRHRGTRLVDSQSGCKKRHVCPYHAWSWDSRGDFVNGPHFETGFPNLDKANLGLRQLPSTERHGFIWLLPETAEQPLESYLGAFDAELEWAGLKDMVVHQSEVQQRRCNWKILVEGGIEAYHFRVAHRNTIAPLFNDNLSSYQCIGPHMRSVLPRASITELAEQPRHSWDIRQHTNVLLNVFPNSSFLVQSDHVVWIAMTPLAVDRSELRLMTLKPKDSTRPDSYWDRNHALSITTLNEDFEIGESIQAGLLSGANEELNFGRFEGALEQFNHAVRQHLPQEDLRRS